MFSKKNNGYILPRLGDLGKKTTDEYDQAVLIAMPHIGRKHMQHQQNTARVEREQSTGGEICWGSRGDNDRL